MTDRLKLNRNLKNNNIVTNNKLFFFSKLVYKIK